MTQHSIGPIPPKGATWAYGDSHPPGWCIPLLLMLALVVPDLSLASESGTGTYHNGLVDLLAGFMAPPGTLVFKNYFIYWDASGQFVTQNGKFETNNHVKVYADIVQSAYVTHSKILGADLGFSLLIPFAIVAGSRQLGLTNAAPFSREQSTVGGMGDMIVTPAALHWRFGRFNLLSTFSVYAPSGSYDEDRTFNIGKNRWSFEPDIGLTWLDKRSGREASAFIGYTLNLENRATHYSSGDEFHADFAVAQHLPDGFELGAAGYAFQQTTGDSGSGAILGAFMGRVFGLGPLAGYSFRIAETSIDLTAKYEFEFGDQNCLAGDALWLTAALRL